MLNMKIFYLFFLNTAFFISQHCFAAEIHSTYMTRFEIQSNCFGGGSNDDFTMAMPGLPSRVTMGYAECGFFTLEIEPVKVDGEWLYRFRILVADQNTDSAEKVSKEVIFERFSPLFEQQYPPIKLQYVYKNVSNNITYTATRYY